MMRSHRQTPQRKHSTSTHSSTLTEMIEPYAWMRRVSDRETGPHHWDRDAWRKRLRRWESPQSAVRVISFHKSRSARGRGPTLFWHTRPVIFVQILAVCRTTHSRRLWGPTTEIGRYVEDSTDSPSNQRVSVHHYRMHLVPQSAKYSNNTKATFSRRGVVGQDENTPARHI